jgi:hypothetical protein
MLLKVCTSRSSCPNAPPLKKLTVLKDKDRTNKSLEEAFNRLEGRLLCRENSL